MKTSLGFSISKATEIIKHAAKVFFVLSDCGHHRNRSR
jgi:hypothetical protein